MFVFKSAYLIMILDITSAPFTLIMNENEILLPVELVYVPLMLLLDQMIVWGACSGTENILTIKAA